MLVFKILTPEQMEHYRLRREVPLAPVDEADGYVHLSTGPQLAETVARHFAEHQALYVLAVEADDLGDKLKWEPSRGGELFPHYYGRLGARDVAWDSPLQREIDGSFLFPEEIGP